MTVPEKACPLVVRTRDRRLEVLAFIHPSAGKQLVKGTIEAGEAPLAAAKRELREESGLTVIAPLTFLGTHQIRAERQLWYFFKCVASGLPDDWEHATEDDHGHRFAFFWHLLICRSTIREAYAFSAPRLLGISLPRLD